MSQTPISGTLSRINVRRIMINNSSHRQVWWSYVVELKQKKKKKKKISGTGIRPALCRLAPKFAL